MPIIKLLGKLKNPLELILLIKFNTWGYDYKFQEEKLYYETIMANTELFFEQSITRSNLQQC